MKKEPTNVIIWNDGQVSQVYRLVIVLGGAMEPGGSSYCDSSNSQQLRSAWKLILGSSLESSLRGQSGRGKKRGVLQQMGFDLNIYSITSGLSWFPAKGVILLPTLAFTSSHFSPCARQNLDFLSFLLLAVQVP